MTTTYNGYIIRRETVPRYADRYRYRCGRIVCRTKAEVMDMVDRCVELGRWGDALEKVCGGDGGEWE